MSDNSSGKGPWGGKSGNDSPWGKKPENNNGGGPNRGGPGRGGPGGGRPPEPPDLDELIRQAQERLGAFFGGDKGNGGKGGGTPRSGGKLPIIPIILVALVIYGLTGFFRVLPEENAVVLTFGEWTRTKAEAGLGYHIPWPIQSVEKVNITFERRLEVGFRDQAPQRGSTGGTDLPEESLMLTGDENIIDIDFVVLWQISDAGKYLFEIKDPENTIKKVAESAMREVIGRTRLQQALTESRAEIEQATQDLMQTMMDDYQSGVTINDVQLQQVDPPGPVVDAFDDVQRARADMERARNDANAYRNDILPRARGQAAQLLQQAEAYREEVVNRASGDAERFRQILVGYNKNQDVTTERIYIETLEKILSNTNKILIDSSTGGAGGVLPYLPLDQLKSTTGTKPAGRSGE
ncbi:MAG: FtsH protease activity modulator HflK [Pseudomonadota bacterium]